MVVGYKTDFQRLGIHQSNMGPQVRTIYLLKYISRYTSTWHPTKTTPKNTLLFLAVSEIAKMRIQ